MRLTDWHLLLADMSAPGANPKMTYVEAMRRGLGMHDAWVASVFLNYQGQELLYTLRLMARDPTFDGFLRALMCMRLSELCSVEGARQTWRALALGAAEELKHNLDRTMLVAWIECTRFMHRDVRRISWTRYYDNLGWLITNGQRDATALALDFVSCSLKRGDLERSDNILTRLLMRIGRHEVPCSAEEAKLAAQLRSRIDRRQVELRTRRLA